MNDIEKAKLEKEINVLASEVSEAHSLIFALKELIEQSHGNFDIYKKYINFFYQTYYSYYNDLIHLISRLQDMTNGSLSVIKLLKRYEKNKDLLSIEESRILLSLLAHPTGKKIKINRNKLGKAHLDHSVAIDPEKAKKIHEDNKVTLEEIVEYTELLTKALEILTYRMDIPISSFLKPTPILRGQIRRLFEDLAGVEKEIGYQYVSNKTPMKETTV